MTDDKSNAPNRTVYVVYASQTGQAKIIAELINDLLTEHQFQPQLFCISRSDKDFKLNELAHPLVMVCSTTGDGETPETAIRCYNKLKRLNAADHPAYLQNLNYALLGLGDTNYTQFCNGPKLFHARFKDLGAKCFYGPFWADDGVGLDLEVEPFKSGLVDALNAFYQSQKQPNTQKPAAPLDHNQNYDLSANITALKIYEPTTWPPVAELTLPDPVEPNLHIEFFPDDDPVTTLSSPDLIKSIGTLCPHSSSSGVFTASLLANTRLTAAHSAKDCHSLTFRIDAHFNATTATCDDNALSIAPGEALDFVCPNSDADVATLLARLDVADDVAHQRIAITARDPAKKLGQTFVALSTACPSLSLHSLFRHCLDFGPNCLKKNMLRTLASHCADTTDEKRMLQLASREGSTQYASLVKEGALSLLDMLSVFASCRPPLDLLIQMLPPLTTRPYSVCSASTALPEIQIVFNVVRIAASGERVHDRVGRGTGHLSALEPGQSVFLMKRRFHNFTFPVETDERPVVLIGPGTGMAPFMSYVRGLEATGRLDQMRRVWLFGGCRRPDEDFLFRAELTGALGARLGKVCVAFSRLVDEGEGRIDVDVEGVRVAGCRYVQDALRRFATDVVRLVVDEGAHVMVCGDARNMSKDVMRCVSECLRSERGWTEADADKYLAEMVKEKRYKQDVWA